MSRIVEVSSPENYKFRALRARVSKIQEAIEEGFSRSSETPEGTVILKAYVQDKPSSDELRIVINEYKQAGWMDISIVGIFEPFGYTLYVELYQSDVSDDTEKTSLPELVDYNPYSPPPEIWEIDENGNKRNLWVTNGCPNILF